ncbi:MAG: hypothetical protein LBS71_00710 [Puniceicoccales bacterium]|jgi:hypothetical protein|nr:hypothetical protein [Puniceicoccales bacterium]
MMNKIKLMKIIGTLFFGLSILSQETFASQEVGAELPSGNSKVDIKQEVVEKIAHDLGYTLDSPEWEKELENLKSFINSSSSGSLSCAGGFSCIETTMKDKSGEQQDVQVEVHVEKDVIEIKDIKYLYQFSSGVYIVYDVLLSLICQLEWELESSGAIPQECRKELERLIEVSPSTLYSKGVLKTKSGGKQKIGVWPKEYKNGKVVITEATNPLTVSMHYYESN